MLCLFEFFNRSQFPQGQENNEERKKMFVAPSVVPNGRTLLQPFRSRPLTYTSELKVWAEILLLLGQRLQWVELDTKAVLHLIMC